MKPHFNYFPKKSCSSGIAFIIPSASASEEKLQYNLNGSNTDGSFTMDDSNSFFSPYKILPIAQENK